jgi:RNA polymerase sigma-70 factor (ECF subfamily)
MRTDPGRLMEFDLRSCIDGDERAWDAFVDRFAPVIYAAVVRTLGPGRGRREAADVVQDVFVRLLQHDRRALRSYDPAKASLVTYLTVVARSVAVSHLRRARPPEPAPLEDVAQLPEPRGEDAPGDAPDVAAAGERLTGRQQLVLHLLFDRQMEVREAAALLGVAAQTVRSTKHKALQRLRAALGDRPP